MITKLLSDGTVVEFLAQMPPGKGGEHVGTVQAKITSGTVQIQGSMLPVGHADQVWTDLLDAALSASGAANVTIFPYMKAVVSGTAAVYILT